MKSAPFMEWLEGKKKTLFCPGILRTGKTMIVVNRLRLPFQTKGRVRHFYIVSTKDRLMVSDLLASLLGQLAVQQSMILKSIHELYDKYRKGERPRLSQDEILEELSALQRLILGPSSLLMLWMSAR